MKRPPALLRLALAAGVLIGSGAGPVPSARAAEETTVLRLRVEQLVAAERCEEALPLLGRLRAEAPGDARAALLQGQCAIRLRRYADAVEPLEAAKRAEPGLAEAGLYLAMAQFHRGDFERAEQELEAVAPRLPDRAEVELYRGLLLLQRARAREAGAALERAGALDPGAVEPVASYYAGLAWAGADERARAERALRRARERAPGTVWADEADRALQRIAQSQRRRAWVRATAGVEYDDNVVLRGSGVVLPNEIADENDVRAVWGAEVGSELFRTRNWAGGILAAYNGSAHDDLNEFNLQYPAAEIWLDRRLSETAFARLSADYGYAWVDADPFLSVYGATLSLEQDWAHAGATRGFVRFSRENYLFPDVDEPPSFVSDPGRQRNRDGNQFLVGLDHSIPIGDATVVRAGYWYDRFDARGREYSSTGHEVHLGVRRALPFDFVLDLAGSFTYRPFRHSSTFPDPPSTLPLAFEGARRRDSVWRGEAVLERPISRNVTLSARYGYVDNSSNVDVFDYDREIVGAYVTVYFDN